LKRSSRKLLELKISLKIAEGVAYNSIVKRENRFKTLWDSKKNCYT